MPLTRPHRDAALNPVSYVVLGLLSSMGRATPYDMKQTVALSIGYFWQFPHSQLYAEPARLAAAGLLDEEVEVGGRRRRYYTLRPEGREALQLWVADPTTDHAELRDLGLLKLFMAKSGTASDIIGLATEEIRSHQERLVEYRELRQAVSEVADRWELRTLTLGERYEALCVEFWQEVRQDAEAEAGAERSE
jgi:PadR family transcriptional regulator, regulatory protein AphA